MPKSYVAFKWAVYAFATLLLFGLQSVVFNHIRVWGITPFFYPMLPALAAMYEGQKRGTIFALFLGIVCDLLLYGPFEGFFTITFVILALLSAVVAENLRSTGFLGGVFIAALALFLTGVMRIGLHALTAGLDGWGGGVDLPARRAGGAAGVPGHPQAVRGGLLILSFTQERSVLWRITGVSGFGPILS